MHLFLHKLLHRLTAHYVILQKTIALKSSLAGTAAAFSQFILQKRLCFIMFHKVDARRALQAKKLCILL